MSHPCIALALFAIPPDNRRAASSVGSNSGDTAGGAEPAQCCANFVHNAGLCPLRHATQTHTHTQTVDDKGTVTKYSMHFPSKYAQTQLRWSTSMQFHIRWQGSTPKGSYVFKSCCSTKITLSGIGNIYIIQKDKILKVMILSL